MQIDISAVLYAISSTAMGMTLALSFLGVKLNKRNVILSSLFFVFGIILLFHVYIIADEHAVEMIYPIVMHLPVLLLCIFGFNKNWFSSLIAIAMSYMCCQFSNWIVVLASLHDMDDMIAELIRFAFALVITILIVKYLSPTVSELLEPHNSSRFFLALNPFLYYIFDYALTVYSRLLYTGSPAIVEGIFFFLSASFIYFCIVYSKQFEKKKEADSRAQLLEIKNAQSERELNAMKRASDQLSILRHDMRHYIAEISMMANTGNYDHLKDYLDSITEKMDSTVAKNYCANPTVNMIVSYFSAPMKEHKIDFQYEISLPQNIKISDTDMTSILSNALENAVYAVQKLPEGLRRINLVMRCNGDKILITVKNSYLKKVRMINGMPYNDRPGHGLGTKSIVYTTEKLGGHCRFRSTPTEFSLDIVI